jgi:hypothetical protein
MDQVMKEITIQVPSDIAEAYRRSSAEYREQLSVRIEALLRRSFGPEVDSYLKLQESMDRLAEQAQQKGLTPEILESILQDD